MRIVDAEAELNRRLAAAGLASNALDPWEAWKVFKTYLLAPVEEGVYDAASFQCDHSGYLDDGTPCGAFFVRQFSERDSSTEEDVGISQVVIEFGFDPGPPRRFARTQVWTHDYATLAEFASVVESTAQFQALVNARPVRTRVHCEEL